jgi:hypothetical protein
MPAVPDDAAAVVAAAADVDSGPRGAMVAQA